MGERTKRIGMTVLGVLLCGLAVGPFQFADFGMDPFQVFAHGLATLAPIGFGTFYTLLNLVILVIIFFLDRKKIGLGTVINMFLVGYMADFSFWGLGKLFPNPGIGVKIILLLVGIVVMCFSSALYFTANLGVSTYDAVAIYWSEHSRVKFQYCRIITDFLCVAVGALLGATAGVGTIITAFFMGPIIAFFRRTVSEPCLYGRGNIPDRTGKTGGKGADK